MTVGAPLGLLGLLAVPALLALYLLRRRQPPRTVSALFLWRTADTRASAGPKLDRLYREAALFAELAAALAATAFLADLRFGKPSELPHTVVVLDGSLSMSARLPGGGTVAEAALARVRALAEADGGRLTLIESGPRPRVLVGPAASREQLDGLRWEPAGPPHDLEPALSLAREFAGPGAKVRFIGDALPSPAPAGFESIETIAVGAPLPNLAFVAASRRDRAGVASIDLRVARFAPGSGELAVRLTTEAGAPVAEQKVTLGEGEERGVRFEVRTDAPLVAGLPADALAADGRLLLLPAPPRPLTVAVRLPEGEADQAVRRFLAADGSTSLADPADLVFAAPGAAAPDPWTVLVGATGETKSLLGPFFPDRTSRLFEGVPLEGLLWAAGPGAPGSPLLVAADRVLVTRAPGPVLRLNVDLERSNLQRTAAWPVLLSNLLALRREALPGLSRRAVLLGEEATATLEPGHRWTLEGPTGSLPLRGSGPTPLPGPLAPGRWRLLADGEPRDELAVLPIARTESELRSRGSGLIPSPAPVGRTGEPRSRSRWPLVLFALFVALDWFVLARPMNGARK